MPWRATRVESTVEETADGKVVALSFTQYPDKGDPLTLTGTVMGDKLLVKPKGAPAGKAVAWNNKAIGPYKQDRLLADRKVKAGDKFEFLSCEPSLFAAVTVRAAIKPIEQVELIEAKKDGEKIQYAPVKQKLLRVELQPDKFLYEGTPVQLPKQLLWVDKDFAIVRSENDFGLGKFLLYRTTKAGAMQPGEDPAKMPDVGLNTIIPIAKKIENMNAQKQAVYRITVQDETEPASTFTRDSRQEVKNVKSNTFELHVRAIRAPVAIENPTRPGKEFLESSYFIESEDKRVKELTAKALGTETDAWQKALRIEKWVHENMHGSSGIGFATAGQVAKDLTGDCRQHAMLTTAMCRAAGVPARTAIGLVYIAPEKQDAFLGFHMWTEVWIKGQWLGLDAVFGEGGVGPGHLKISDHSWHNTQTLAPVLPVLRVMGKAKVEVLSVK